MEVCIRNVVNQGRITNLTNDCVVEIPGYVDRTGLHKYAHEIPLVKTRLEAADRNGTRVKTVKTQGAARLHMKSVEEMARDAAEARANAGAAD